MMVVCNPGLALHHEICKHHQSTSKARHKAQEYLARPKCFCTLGFIASRPAAKGEAKSREDRGLEN